MKKTICASFLAMTAAVYAQEMQEPAIPVGKLSVDSNLVQAGAKPKLTWDITFPKNVEEVVEVDPDDEITPKTRLRLQVFVLGVGITDQTGREYPARSEIRFSSNSSWQGVYTGVGSQSDPTRAIHDRIVEAGNTITFRARVFVRGFGYYNNDSSNIQVLQNGDFAPGNAGGYDQDSIADYLQSAVDPDTGRLVLGPLDLIYACELTHSDENHRGYDVQDTVVLLRFTEIEE